jgi:hypothetical protein
VERASQETVAVAARSSRPVMESVVDAAHRDGVENVGGAARGAS